MNRSIALLTIAATALLAVFATPAVLAQPQGLLTDHVQPAVLNGRRYSSKASRKPNHAHRHSYGCARSGKSGSFSARCLRSIELSYRQFLTVDQFTQKFGPSQHDYDALVRFASANGLTMTGGSRDAMDVQFKGSVAAFETAFHVNLGVYHDANANRNFYSPDREPTIDLPFQLWHITGLDNYSIPRSLISHRPPGVNLPLRPAPVQVNPSAVAT